MNSPAAAVRTEKRIFALVGLRGIQQCLAFRNSITAHCEVLLELTIFLFENNIAVYVGTHTPRISIFVEVNPTNRPAVIDVGCGEEGGEPSVTP